jgi:lysophospholipid acyltransferase (LPLAT)-like uncharacterized protein
VGILGAGLLRALAVTWRVRSEGPDPFDGEAFVGAIWHRGFLAAAILWRDRGLVVPVSRSRDGDLIDGVLGRLGFSESARGSSSRGGALLLRDLVRRARAGSVVGFIPDGPRGPAYQAKPGVVALARLAGVRLVPVGVSATPRIPIGSWDEAFLPAPFARVRCRYGTPIHVPMDAGAADLAELTRQLERDLTRLDGEVEAELQSS